MRNRRKEKVGKIVSNKSDKTVVVLVEQMTKHSLYGKFINRSTKFMAHDEKNECKMGDLVKIMEVRPLSKRKRWRLVQILERIN